MARRGIRSFVLGLALVAAVLIPESAARLSGQVQAPAPSVDAIRNATLITVSRGTINNGTIVMRDGKIAAIGTNVQIPAGATVVDGTGKFVTPGLIDAHSHIGNDTINEGATTVSSMTDMGQVLNPTNIAIQRNLAGGLTTANILHGSAKPIGGGSVTIKLRWGVKKGDDLIFEGSMPCIKFALGENPKRQGGSIIFSPTDADIAAIPEGQRHLYVLQRRVAFMPVIRTPAGDTQAELRIMMVSDGDGYRAVMPLVRMGRGKMMGVDHNKGPRFVGASAALMTPDAATTPPLAAPSEIED